MDPSAPSGSGLGGNGQTFGGAVIIGFSPGSTKQSIMVYKKKDHFVEWEFTYDPIGDPTFRGNGVKVQPSGSSLVGSGTGSNRTGPAMSPNPGPQQQVTQLSSPSTAICI